jgi:hypothetical protein
MSKTLELPYYEDGHLDLGYEEQDYRQALKAYNELKEAYEAISEKLEDRADTLLRHYFKHHPDAKGSAPRWGVDEFEVRGDELHMEWEVSHCSCCGPDHYSETLPVAWLWADFDDLTAEWEALKQSRLKAKEEAEAKRAEEARIAREKAERAEFERLQAKFGATSV